MAETQKNISKKLLIEQIMLDINDVPAVYLKTLYAIIHSFKENITTIQPPQSPLPVSEDDDNFDWDSLLHDVHANRQKNNTLIHNRLQALTDSL